MGGGGGGGGGIPDCIEWGGGDLSLTCSLRDNHQIYVLYSIHNLQITEIVALAERSLLKKHARRMLPLSLDIKGPNV